MTSESEDSRKTSRVALRAAIFIVLMPGAIGGWIPYLIAGGHSRIPVWTADRVLGVVLFVVGWSILLWCTFEFVQRGRGTPSPNSAPVELVTTGLFCFVRNPMYVGVVTAISGIALARHSWSAGVYGATVAVAFHLRVVLYEEPRLTREFGDAYLTYRERVNRWIPGPGSRNPS
ncbi:MAG TPA: isoprenylcysteine carboxylmethyltransferase family protein [Gemmatimonadaceae bacterium]|jgi:protein-S-isoprenylcysteine O-methyltransferase Ste14